MNSRQKNDSSFQSCGCRAAESGGPYGKARGIQANTGSKAPKRNCGDLCRRFCAKLSSMGLRRQKTCGKMQVILIEK
ncbi:hypothetical protein AALA80_02965 [Oscillospiraceae bacterium 50-60]